MPPGTDGYEGFRVDARSPALCFHWIVLKAVGARALGAIAARLAPNSNPTNHTDCFASLCGSIGLAWTLGHHKHALIMHLVLIPDRLGVILLIGTGLNLR